MQCRQGDTPNILAERGEHLIAAAVERAFLCGEFVDVAGDRENGQGKVAVGQELSVAFAPKIVVTGVAVFAFGVATMNVFTIAHGVKLREVPQLGEALQCEDEQGLGSQAVH